MTQYTWEEFYDKFFEWSASTQVNRISCITDFGTSNEVYDIAFELPEEKSATRFLKKAIEAGIKFTGDEIVELISIVSKDFIPVLVEHCSEKYTVEQMYYIKDYIGSELFENLENIFGPDYSIWENFYEGHSYWTTEKIIEKAKSLKTYGKSEEVVEVSYEFMDADKSTEFIKAAVESGIRFKPQEIVELLGNVKSEYYSELLKYNTKPYSYSDLVK